MVGYIKKTVDAARAHKR